MVDFLRTLKRQLEIFFYRRTGRVPLARSYPVCKDYYVRRIVRDEAVLRVFQDRLQLPREFGVRFDERVVEYPWVFSKLLGYNEKCRFLDAGSTLNHEFIMQHPLVRRQKWSILTLAPERECFSSLGISYIYDDLRTMPFKEACFDAVFCISVIEHIGMDNSQYANGAYREDKREDYICAINEMKRVLKGDGWLFLTVPFGRYENHGWLQQFDSAMLLCLVSHFQPKRCETTFYRSTPQGWELCTEDDCKGLTYQDSLMSKSAPDGAIPPVSATGLACVALQK